MKSNALCLLFMVAFWSNIGQIRAQSPTVCLAGSNKSCLLGTFMPGYEGDPFEAFLGIPFAKPPIGKLRFSDPKKVKLWKDTLSAEAPKSACLQKNNFADPAPTIGSEDCLYLNVYRPQNKTSEKLPVIFYIHGGRFFMGSPNPVVMGPEYFMDTKEVIVVLAAYRFGPFGFLSTNDTKMTGNFGIKDQLMALKWVNKHISAFGGDPDSVTISGISSGAASVHYHMLSPASKGLFHKAIFMSGTANAQMATPVDDPKAQVIELAEAAGIKNPAELTSSKLVKALRKIDAIDLLTASEKLRPPMTYPLETFRPNIEDPQWKNAILTKDVFSSLAGNSNSISISVPWIIANVPSKGEGLDNALHLTGNQTMRDILNANFRTNMIRFLELPNPDTEGATLDSLVSEYMNGVYELNDDTLDGFLELLGDVKCIHPAFQTIRSYLSTHDASRKGSSLLKGIIKFNYKGPYTYSTIYSASSKNFSTAHGDDLVYLFRIPYFFPDLYPVSSPEAALVRRYVGLYVEFAKTGKVEVFEQMNTCTKDLLVEGECQYLSIVNSEEQFQVGGTWDIKRMELLDNVYHN